MVVDLRAFIGKWLESNYKVRKPEERISDNYGKRCGLPMTGYAEPDFLNLLLLLLQLKISHIGVSWNGFCNGSAAYKSGYLYA